MPNRLDKDFVTRPIKVANELPNVETLQHIESTALNHITTLPEEDRIKEYIASNSEVEAFYEITFVKVRSLKVTLEESPNFVRS